MPQDVADFQGRLSFETRLSAVLERVMELKKGGVSILRLTDQASNRTGEIAIMNGKYACGAVLRKFSSKTELCTGYEALRALCRSASADFVYLTNASDFLEDLTLNIELAAIVNLVPELPEDRNSLQNDEFAMKRIFGTFTGIECVPVKPTLPTSKSSDDGWKAAVSGMGAAARSDAEPDYSRGVHSDGGSTVIDEGETPVPSLQERAEQEFGDTQTEPAAPTQSSAQKLLRKPALFAMNVLTASAQMLKMFAIVLAIFLAVGGSIYLGSKFFPSMHSVAQHPSPPPQPPRPAASVIRRITRVSAVRRPAAATIQNAYLQQHSQSSAIPAPAASPAPASTADTTPHRRAYQTYR